MKIVLSKNKLIKYIHKEKNLGFVPTMGALHLGHLSLIKKCKSQCDKTIVSIFINKPQFHRINDFRNYPRTFTKDIKKLRDLKIDYLYLPSNNQIYPNGHNKNIKISSFGNKLCGKTRPGHFKAVVDVVERFVKIISPRKIYLGKKDFQQLKIIEDYFIKKNIKTKVVACNTIRENNGLAHSSRNLLLSPSKKKMASKVIKLIMNKKKDLIKKIITTKILKNKILKFGVKKIDYVEMIDINKITKPFKKIKRYKIFIAYYIDSIRLIDNI